MFEFCLSHDVHNQVLSETELVWIQPFNFDAILASNKNLKPRLDVTPMLPLYRFPSF